MMEAPISSFSKKVDQNRRFFRVLAAAVDGKGQIYFRKSAVGLPAKGDLIPSKKRPLAFFNALR